MRGNRSRLVNAGFCHFFGAVCSRELSLAADVFDIEPLPSNDPLPGHPHVVHTPHNAGRTQQAGERWIEALFEQFSPV